MPTLIGGRHTLGSGTVTAGGVEGWVCAGGLGAGCAAVVGFLLVVLRFLGVGTPVLAFGRVGDFGVEAAARCTADAPLRLDVALSGLFAAAVRFARLTCSGVSGGVWTTSVGVVRTTFVVFDVPAVNT